MNDETKRAITAVVQSYREKNSNWLFDSRVIVDGSAIRDLESIVVGYGLLAPNDEPARRQAELERKAAAWKLAPNKTYRQMFPEDFE